jgi:hypothetical protein
MHLSGLDEEAPEQENAQDDDNRDDDNLDQAHSKILRVGAKSGTKALKQANSTSLGKQLSTNLPPAVLLPFSGFWPRSGYDRPYEGGTLVVLQSFGGQGGRTLEKPQCVGYANSAT